MRSLVVSAALGLPAAGCRKPTPPARAPASAACSEGDGWVAAAWTPARRERIAAALAAAAGAYGDQAASSLLPRLDRYADAWRQEHRQCCEWETTGVRVQASLAYLDAARWEMQATLDLLEEPDPQIALHATWLVAALPPLPQHFDDDAATLLDARTTAGDLHHALTVATVALRAGRAADAITSLERVVAQATAPATAHLRARAQLTLAQAREAMGASDDDTYALALRDAVAVGDAADAATACDGRLRAAARRGDTGAFDRGDGCQDAMGSARLTTADWGMRELMRGRLEDAGRLLALASQGAPMRSDRQIVGASAIRSNLGVVYALRGDFGSAHHLFGLAADATHDVLGPSHPGVALALQNAAISLAALGDDTRAAEAWAEVAAIHRRLDEAGLPYDRASYAARSADLLVATSTMSLDAPASAMLADRARRTSLGAP